MSSSIKITARELRSLLSPVLPLAGKDDMLPVIAAVLLEVPGDYLTATATDRFRVGISRVKLDKPPADFRALVSTGDLRRALSLFKATRRLDPPLILRVDDSEHVGKLTQRLIVESDGASLDGAASARLAFWLVDGEYPKVQGIVHKALTNPDAPVSAVALNPIFLADFQHAQSYSGEPLIFKPGPDSKRPVGVMCGEHFIGAIMPRRMFGEKADGANATGLAEALATWTPILDTPAEAKSDAA